MIYAVFIVIGFVIYQNMTNKAPPTAPGEEVDPNVIVPEPMPMWPLWIILAGMAATMFYNYG